MHAQNGIFDSWFDSILDTSTPQPDDRQDGGCFFFFDTLLGQECNHDRIYKKTYRKIPKISPYMYKPQQIKASQTGNAKNPLLNRPSKYKPPEGLYLENCPQIQSETKQKR